MKKSLERDKRRASMMPHDLKISNFGCVKMLTWIQHISGRFRFPYFKFHPKRHILASQIHPGFRFNALTPGE
jgi:hypothetical protein